MDRTVREFGISRGEFDVLATLRRSGKPYTLSPAAALRDADAHHRRHAGRLDKLERAGLLRRSPDPTTGAGCTSRSPRGARGLVDEAVGAGLAVQTEALPPWARSGPGSSPSC